MPSTGTAPIEEMVKNGVGEKGDEASCDTCFFGLSALCSLPKGEACPTFRLQFIATLRAGSSGRNS